jgi:phosphohistidine phosphatase SixA
MQRALKRALTILLGASAWALTALAASNASAVPEPGALLLQQLRHGDDVLVMRHAQSPEALPSAQAAEPDNVRYERQLSEAGKASARALGAELHALRIPLGPIYSSPTYRALQTVPLAGLGSPQPIAALAEGPRGMAGNAGRAEVRWLQRAVAQAPPAGSNTLIVTHTPNIVGAFGPSVADIQATEMLIFRTDHGHDHGHAHLVGRLTVEQWRQLAAGR